MQPSGFRQDAAEAKLLPVSPVQFPDDGVILNMIGLHIGGGQRGRHCSIEHFVGVDQGRNDIVNIPTAGRS